MKLPNLIIGGVHKAATTSLFSYLMKHPDICGSSKKEIHHFTPLRYNLPLKSIDRYAKYFSHCRENSEYFLEASPSYLYGKNIIADEIFNKLNSPKILFILRDPVDRFISYYKHCEGKFLIPRNTTFEEFFSQNLKNYQTIDKDDPFYRGLREGNYIDYLEHWINNYPENIKVVFFENLINNPKQTVISICKWLELEYKVYDDFDFLLANKTKRYGKKYLHFLARYFNMKFEYLLRKNLKFKQLLKRAYLKLNGIPEVEIDDITRNRLVMYYKKKNEELAKYLFTKGYTVLPEWLEVKKTEH
jgi:hypothetical protein